MCLQGDGHREENEPITKTHGLRTTLFLTVPKARHPKASLVPPVRAQRRTRHSTGTTMNPQRLRSTAAGCARWECWSRSCRGPQSARNQSETVKWPCATNETHEARRTCGKEHRRETQSTLSCRTSRSISLQQWDNHESEWNKIGEREYHQKPAPRHVDTRCPRNTAQTTPRDSSRKLSIDSRRACRLEFASRTPTRLRSDDATSTRRGAVAFTKTLPTSSAGKSTRRSQIRAQPKPDSPT